MSNKLTTAEFIQKAQAKHKHLYDYSKTKYVNTKTKVIITCPIHGDFEQTPMNHYKYGCSLCAGMNKTTNSFIEKAKQVHGNKYCYDKSVYVNSCTKLTIICKLHGEFSQRANAHENGQGCPKCGIEHVKNLKFYTISSFIDKASKVHKNVYDYSNFIYTDSMTKSKIICSIHGTFLMAPNTHLQGQGCPKCGVISRSKKQRLGIDKFIKKANEVHSNTYDYAKSVYTNNNTKVTIICPIHGDFEQVPNSHLNGCGCPLCAKYGFDYNKSAILYYLKITFKDKILYKIGITNRTVNERFDINDLSKIEVLHQKLYTFGKDAYKNEQKILYYYKNYKYLGPKVLTSNGNTELFITDISIIDNGFNNIFF